MKTFLIILAFTLFIWIVYGYFSSRVKEPKFSVVSKKSGYEIREYAPYIEARVKVSGEYREAMSSGFRILAGYIFGGNTGKKSIAMTAPVSEQKSEKNPESIAMTAPVSEMVLADNSRVVSFVMPEEYTLATVPTPNEKRIEIVEVPSHRSAVLRYSGYNNAEKVADMKTKLLEYLKRDNVAVVGMPRGAGYNPPWTPPFMMRNEILVDINK
ncbi:heme-binding protein [Patescibacteria group bacterium]|nr:heme-binding protein [Patescibacteria group bacterium]